VATVAETVPAAPRRRRRATATTELQTGRLVAAHIWVAIAAFAVACILGVWQMWARSPIEAPYHSASNYFRAVTLHGVSMAFVLTTFFIMGFGYYVAETALKRPLPGLRIAWGAFALGIVGTLMASLSVLSGNATVLYTFYPPMTATAWFYIGLVLVVVGSWVWCILMIVAMRSWKNANPGQAVPLAMFATVANAIMWLWTTVGVAAELLFQVIPAALGWNGMVDVGLSRTLFSWTLHAIVYFWLFPSYIAFYTMFPRAAGGRLYSDTMGRLAFILFLLYSLPVGLHHLFMDPEHSNGFKFIQMFLTALVAVPTLLTIFTITASAEVAGRMRGGRGALGWIKALPWERPMVLATGLAFFMLFFGGGGGLINMSYGMNAMVHNTSWVTAHFHLIFGGTVVIMYFAIAYAIWPSITGRHFEDLKPLRIQLWMWFTGMMVMTLPWHWTGLQGQWRRVAAFDYSDPMIAAWGPWVVVSLIGGIILAISAILFVYNLALLHRAGIPGAPRTIAYARAIHPPERVPSSLNGFGLWNLLVALLMLGAYGYPIAQFFLDPPPEAVVHKVSR
jgi:cytochrome c oxidase subunit I